MVKSRVKWLKTITFVFFALILARLFYWQILSSQKLQALGLLQYEAERRIEPLRGEILSADGFALASNKKRYTLFAYKPSLTEGYETISQKLAPILASTFETASAGAQLTDSLTLARNHVFESLNQSSQWVPLKRNLDDETKSRLESINLQGLGFDESYTRYYSESSLSAHLYGFVGSDQAGFPQGYFGLEGYYHRELTGKPGFISGESDVFGRPILYGGYQEIQKKDGRSLKTHLDRGLQLLIENELKEGLNRYTASSGEVVVMEPQTGAILALAAFPNYAPGDFYRYSPSTYRIPAVADTYEPGSTFKAIIMAAGINEGLITPDTTCDATCNGPVSIGKYAIRTWNNQYYPNQTMREVLERSDNTGMVFVANQFSKDKFVQYLKDFGIGAATNIDLESETVVPLKDRWGDIDLATDAFGQGIDVNYIQMLAAIGAIANGGVRLEPHVVETIFDQDGQSIELPPKEVKSVITSQTAQVMTDLLETAAKHGEAQWAIPKGYRFAGKTGTAQVPIAGHYDANKTIASFVGFAPANRPRFVMLVKLAEPQSSPWASETAAPLWVKIAKEMYLYFNLEPD